MLSHGKSSDDQYDKEDEVQFISLRGKCPIHCWKEGRVGGGREKGKVGRQERDRERDKER